MADLRTISDVSTMHGIKVNSSDVIIPKAYHETLLQAYPELLEQVKVFFENHDRAKCVVIKNFTGE